MVVCLLEREPATWLVCFVPAIERQWWHRFLGKFKHCYCLKKDGNDRWTLFEPWWSRILMATITDEEAERFIRWGRRGHILEVKEHIPGSSSQLRGWMSCGALVAHVLGRSYFVYTPYQLFKRLIKEPGTRSYEKG